MKKILLLLLITATFSGCEKDDVCTDETTPRLIIGFYDITNNANPKNVLNLKVKAEGAADFIVFNTSMDKNNPDRYLFNGNKLELPLKINDTITTYRFILNSTSTTNSNEDIFDIHYTPENVFVSRACGYKTIFELDNPGGVIKRDTTTPENFWIRDFSIITANIETENETHIKIYF